MALKNKAVFIDKDGTLIKNVPYNIDLSLIEFAPLAAESLKLIQELNFKLFMVSNQSGIAKGLFDVQQVENVFKYITQNLKKRGINIQGFAYCPHHPDGKIVKYRKTCTCRKPEPGLIHEIAYYERINLDASWMIGDILNDIEAGKRAGNKTILINNGSETDWFMSDLRTPDFFSKNLFEAAKIIARESIPKSLYSEPKEFYA